MKQLFLILIILFFATEFTNSQTISNVHFVQSDKQIVIYYDLSGMQGTTWDITIFCSQDGGVIWGNPLRMITGDIGNAIKPGFNKQVQWNVLSERDRLEGVIKFKVEAKGNNKSSSSIPKVKPNYSTDYNKYKKQKTFWFVSAGVTGVIGVFANIQSNKYYDQYQTATTEAGNLYKKADLYDMITPIAIGVAGFCTLEFILKSGKYSKARKQSLGLFPAPYNKGGGFGLAYNF